MMGRGEYTLNLNESALLSRENKNTHVKRHEPLGLAATNLL